MEFTAPPTLPFVVQDVLVAVGAGVALLAGLAFLNLGLLLPGLLTSLGGPQPDQRGPIWSSARSRVRSSPNPCLLG
jgi:ABC-type dipeptide/oligopeptide/nickel transport system permease subunit